MATKKPQNKYHEFLQLVYLMRKYQHQAKSMVSRDANAIAESYERKVDEWLKAAGFEAEKIERLKAAFAEGQKKLL